jgi:TorA maturation chaperone TorD
VTDFDLEQGIARADLCRFIAACYYQPGPEFAEERVFESMAGAASRLDPDLAVAAHRLGEAFAAEGHQALLVEYTRLFLGPVDPVALPYGSVWLEPDGGLMRDSTRAVEGLYHQCDFEVAEDVHDLPDHIAVELEFLYLLIFRENEAHLKDDAAALQATLKLRERFLHAHLGRWVPTFTDSVRAGTQSAFYRELAGLTERYVMMETARNPLGGDSR